MINNEYECINIHVTVFTGVNENESCVSISLCIFLLAPHKACANGKPERSIRMKVFMCMQMTRLKTSLYFQVLT